MDGLRFLVLLVTEQSNCEPRPAYFQLVDGLFGDELSVDGLRFDDGDQSRMQE